MLYPPRPIDEKKVKKQPRDENIMKICYHGIKNTILTSNDIINIVITLRVYVYTYTLVRTNVATTRSRDAQHN